MAGLQAWVKQLVLVALLAAVAEMLLPQSRLRRYAHAALGLLVLLAVLVPFLALLHRGVDWEAAFAALPGSAPAAGVEAGVRRLREVDRQLVLDTYRRQLEQAAARVAAGVAGVARAEAKAEIDADPRSPRYGTVRRLALAVWPGRRPSVGGVEEVPPVEIGRPTGTLVTPEQAGRLREAVAAAVSREFGLEARQVGVEVMGEGREGGAPPRGGSGGGGAAESR